MRRWCWQLLPVTMRDIVLNIPGVRSPFSDPLALVPSDFTPESEQSCRIVYDVTVHLQQAATSCPRSPSGAMPNLASALPTGAWLASWVQGCCGSSKCAKSSWVGPPAYACVAAQSAACVMGWASKCLHAAIHHASCYTNMHCICSGCHPALTHCAHCANPARMAERVKAHPCSSSAAAECCRESPKPRGATLSGLAGRGSSWMSGVSELGLAASSWSCKPAMA